MQLEDMILISVDDHVVEPPSLGDFFRENLPAKFKDRAPKVIRRADGTDAWLDRGAGGRDVRPQRGAGSPARELGERPVELRPGAARLLRRARAHPRHERQRRARRRSTSRRGPASAASSSCKNDDHEFVAAMTRTYNDWMLHEWCGQYPGRFVPIGISGFMLGADWMAAEIRRLAELGCHAVSCHPDAYRFGAPDYHGDEWDPAWQRRGGDGQRDGVPLRWLPELHAAHAVLGDPARDAVPDGDLRRRAAVVEDLPEVPGHPLRARRGRHRLDPVLPREGRLRLRPPPGVDGRGLRRPAPEPGVPPARAGLLHRRHHRPAQPRRDRHRHDHVGVRLPALRLARGRRRPRCSGSRCRRPS